MKQTLKLFDVWEYFFFVVISTIRKQWVITFCSQNSCDSFFTKSCLMSQHDSINFYSSFCIVFLFFESQWCKNFLNKRKTARSAKSIFSTCKPGMQIPFAGQNIQRQLRSQLRIQYLIPLKHSLKPSQAIVKYHLESCCYVSPSKNNLSFAAN